MYAEKRTVFIQTPGHSSASNPAFWAKNFSHSKPLSLYQRLTFSTDKRWKLIQKYITGHGKVLEAGCGFGEWVAFLQSRGVNGTGVDYSDDLIRQLRQVYPRFEWDHADIRNLPFEDKSYSGIVSWGVIEHCEEGPLAALKEFRRILASDGRVIVTVPLDSPYQRRASEVFFGDSTDQREKTFFQYFMTEADLRGHMKQAGLKVLETGRLGRAYLSLQFPRLYKWATAHPKLFRIINTAVYGMFFWKGDCQNMLYAVAERDDR